MDNLSVSFLGKEYSIPTDVVTYVGLVDFTNDIRDALMSSFKRQIRPNVDVMESDTFMVSAFNDQAAKFVRKLLDNDIYDCTANDYLHDNKGYKLFLDTKKKVLRQVTSIRAEKLETYKAGVEGATYRREASVTGLDFGIISSSFVNHMIYAYMDASKQSQQAKEALKTYNREIAELDKQAAEYDRQENAYISENVIPAMNTVFTFFAYELLDRYISDLIKVGKFDKATLRFIDLERSNDLLKNLDLSNNQEAIIESAFVACPFNTAVYMQAMKYDLLDYKSFLAADSFKQGDKILEFLKESIGVANYPSYAQPNLHNATLLSRYTNKPVGEILFQHTASYANAVISEYSKITAALNSKKSCRALWNQSSEDEILTGESMSIRLANSLVRKIAPNAPWNSLVEQCGHAELFDKLVRLLPNEKNINNKLEYDDYLTKALIVALENERKDLVQIITEKRAREEEARKRAEEKRQKKQIKTTLICGAVAFAILFAISLPSTIKGIKASKKRSIIENRIQEVTSSLEQKIESQINDDIVIDFSYSKFMGSDTVFDWTFSVEMAKFEEFRKNGGQDEKILLEIMDNCKIIEAIVRREDDTFNFDIEYDGRYISISNFDGSVKFGDLSSHETFYYEEYSGERYLHSRDTEYILSE